MNSNGKKSAVLVAATSLLIGITAGLYLQYRDAFVIIEATVTSDHEDKFHFYSDHGDGWVRDEWSRPLKAGVTTKLYFKFHRSGIRRFKFEPLRSPGEIRFESVRFADGVNHPLQLLPADQLTPWKDIEQTTGPETYPQVFRAPESAKDPQIYVLDGKRWSFSTRRHLWDSRLFWRVGRISAVSLLLLLPIALTATRTHNGSSSEPSKSKI